MAVKRARASGRPKKPREKSAAEKAPRERAEKRTPHAFWSGTISFGLVTVPVSLFPTVHGTPSSLRMLAPDGSPLQRRYYCPAHESDVHSEHIQRGYEVEEGEYIVLRDEELESVEPKKSHVIELRQFVERSEISPAYFERAYVLTPAGESTKAYHLLAAAMEESDRVGIATFVMRDREYLVAILSEGGVLRAQTMRFHDELRSPKDIGLEDPEEVDQTLVSQFKRFIRGHSEKSINESELKDDRAERLRKLAEKKRQRGADVVEIQEEAADEVATEEGEANEVDLVEAIRRSLRGESGSSRTNRRREPRADARSTDNPSKQTLLSRARRLDIPGTSSMTKAELTKAIRKASR